ncbi:unnamed protein product [Nippostrongylus brasiliensis]|uniref:DUF3606 domain-containing protein n=1 Tax=Nippostrongylus brasiliensis TaxID=27835 RepID=A0A0N4XDV2_NIPBR|nr:unnamed protein product [Nippostrongylus brasiliensis]
MNGWNDRDEREEGMTDAGKAGGRADDVVRIFAHWRVEKLDTQLHKYAGWTEEQVCKVQVSSADEKPGTSIKSHHYPC